MEFCETGTSGSCDTGRENTQLLKDHAETFPAAEYCADLVAHGYDDWYLPSYNELDVVYDNLKAGKPAGTHNFLNTFPYWSSSELDAYFAFYQFFTNGSLEALLKDSTGRVRCVRR